MAKRPKEKGDASSGEPAPPRKKISKKKAKELAREEAEARKKRRREMLSWAMVLAIVLFFAAMRFGRAVESPWREILIVVQILCPIAAVVIFFRLYPHPLRSMNRKLARERQELKRESRRKKSKRKI